MITVEKGDITTYAVDAIVNAANPTLLGGGGVDGAIHTAAGPRLVAACREIGGCKVGQAVITPGFNLPARHVIHTVGPVFQGGGRGEAEQLAACYASVLRLADQNALTEIVFPSISTGVYGYPVQLAAPVAVGALLENMPRYPGIRRVILVGFTQEVCDAYADAVRRMAAQ